MMAQKNKLQINDSKKIYAGITQNQEVPYFHCGPLENNEQEKQNSFSKNLVRQ